MEITFAKNIVGMPLLVTIYTLHTEICIMMAKELAEERFCVDSAVGGFHIYTDMMQSYCTWSCRDRLAKLSASRLSMFPISNWHVHWSDFVRLEIF